MTSHQEQTVPDVLDPYVFVDGVFHLPNPVIHRDEDYDPAGYAMLRRMQARHFWYRGRHRFLRRALARSPLKSRFTGLRVIDIGGGCGGWMADFVRAYDIRGSECAIADSSLAALQHAGQVLPASVNRYRVDLLDLQWRNRWDVVFLLDVLEHVSDDVKALRQIWNSLAPGGMLFITAPALKQFWSWNDDLAHHQRRYSRADFISLAREIGFRLYDARYFMFFLSPLLLASRRMSSRKAAKLSAADIAAMQRSMHRVPWPPINLLLRGIFSAESPLGHYVRLPWGTSILGVFQKPK